MEMMILHGRAVVRGCQKAMPVIDMPFGSYEEGPQQAFRNASRLMAETGAPAVKLEGGQHMAETIAFLTQRGVPVMAHVGLTPQSVNTLGGYKVVGRAEEAEKVMADSKAVEAAGAFSIVLEKVPAGLAGRITAELSIPTIGIGAGVNCDGQVLVVAGPFHRLPAQVRQALRRAGPRRGRGHRHLRRRSPLPRLPGGGTLLP
jgi:3-methyl-2-oxobutanoate hydroxymethyltransferase